MGFRSLFNLPESITLLRSLDLGPEDEDSSYWQLALRYGLDGNLQSVLDEYVHVLRTSLGHVTSEAEAGAWPIAETIQQAVSIRSNLLTMRELNCEASTQDEMRREHKLRCRYAMGFGLTAEDTGGDQTRDDHVRSAFNSPFRPFVLATTSIGQEGLDFHWYCHRIHHWNLPSNPVDLEQREGRVNRYKGHAIRRNIAERYGAEMLRNVGNGSADGNASKAFLADPWDTMFTSASERADRAPGATDLDPFWVFEDGSARVERHVPSLPLSRERAFLADLKRSLVAYRLVFGQPRQEDLIEFLTDRAELDREVLEEVLRECRIDLSGM
jgi:hypothetical protein